MQDDTQPDERSAAVHTATELFLRTGGAAEAWQYLVATIGEDAARVLWNKVVGAFDASET
jgi:hypothetical protein